MNVDAMRCVAIGVSDAPPLDYLPGAVNGAKAFGDWASSLGIPTKVLIDDEKPIGIEAIREAFELLFKNKPKISRFLVYFSGHGLALPAAGDLWLLSEWSITLRAVSVSRLRDRLSRYGVSQLTLVSDACRSPAATLDSASVADDPVLNRGPFDRKEPDIDWLRASSPFQAAYMVKGARDEEDRCIFSGLLTEALVGAHDAAFDPPGGAQISNFSLKKFLMSEVPSLAGRYKVTLEPHIDTGFVPPDNIYVGGRPTTAPVLKPWPSGTEIGAMNAASSGVGGRRGWSTFGVGPHETIDESGVTPGGTRGATRRKRKSLKDIVARDKEAFALAAVERNKKMSSILTQYGSEHGRPTRFETRAGVFASGAEIADISLGRWAIAELAESPDARRFRSLRSSDLRTPAPLLIAFDNGNWGGAAGIPDRIATFTIQGKEVVSVIYRLNGGLPGESYDTEYAVAQLRAGTLSVEAGYGLAARLRLMKAQDPVRAVLAAYIYHALGDIENICRVAYYLNLDAVSIPFDVALLARLRARRREDGSIEVEVPQTSKRTPRSSEEELYSWTRAATPATLALVAGAFPWLRQGWSLLEDQDRSDLIFEGLSTLSKELLPSPFTTLSAKGGTALKRMIEEK